ncbi:MAG: hypothetical protein AXA67_06585 [Methylothermaceae bacteria B42]|nr:MAG: hypothetical protein AXA67_06585 [Methylothermaceae bacteria B42]HHJ39793.1 DUF4124 domain-containing protein [Methylothermaceae bacterium]
MRIPIAIGLGLFALTNMAAADVYKYVDSSGQVYYSDKPRHSRYKLIIRSSMSRRRGKSLATKRALYSPLIEKIAKKYDLDPALLHAVIRAESSYNPKAVSPKGAVGLMQLMPETARRYGVEDRHDPAKNIEAGSRYLRDLIDTFGDIKLAVAAYNAGEAAVKKYGNQIPPYLETRHYVSRVLNFYQR